MVKMSVIVPVFNGERTIKKCLESILRSEFQGLFENSGGDNVELEVVVVNDGSTDSTLEIIENIASKDSRLSVYTQENKGPAGSRQTGLEKSTGDFICWVDSDDWTGLSQDGWNLCIPLW